MLYLCHRNQGILPRRHPLGFTFVEILVALCVVLIALVPLIHLHVLSIRQVDAATRVARATLLADAKLAEAAVQDVMEFGRSQGRVDDADLRAVFHWVLTVTDAHPLELGKDDLSGVRHIHVDVAWQDGEHDRMVSLDTFVRASAQYESRILDTENDGQRRKKTTIRGFGF